jgi:hypothetical protein
VAADRDHLGACPPRRSPVAFDGEDCREVNGSRSLAGAGAQPGGAQPCWQWRTGEPSLARTGMALAQTGMALAQMGMALARTGMALARMGMALARMGMALARMGLAVAHR